MILDSLLNFNEDTKYTDYEDIVLEADDFGDGTGPSNDDDDEDDYEVTDGDDNSSDNNSNDNTDNSSDADQPDAQSDDDDYEIQDDDSEQSNVDNSGDDTSTQSDEQNSGDDDNGDDNNQDNNQDSSDATDDQNTDDDSDDDDYEIQDDDSDGSDDGGTDDGGTDANDDGSDSGSDDAESSGDGMDNNGDDPRAKLNELEKSIFDQLPPEQQQAKTLELKGLYQMAFNNCQKIIDSISTTEANPNNTKVFDYIVSRLTDLKGYITDYLNDVFDSKGYLENMTEFQKYLAIFDTIKNTFEEIQKEDNKEE